MNGGGVSYVLQPSFGFIIGFGVSAFLISVLVRKNILTLISQSKEAPKLGLYVKIVGFALVSLLVMYVFGITYMYLIMTLYMGKEITLDYLIFTANGIFILLDMLKFAIAIPIGVAVLKRLPSSFSVYKKGAA
jgi:biotin transport system substrate-specific component